MHRAPFLQQLKAYARSFSNSWEKASVARFESFVNANPDCFERSLRIGHITASAWVVSPDGQNSLLTHHRKLGKWFQLGGHVDGNPKVLEAAEREVREESGLEVVALTTAIFDLDVHSIPERGDEP